jgi:hypothetical protein
MEIITLKQCGFKQVLLKFNSPTETYYTQCELVEGHSGDHLINWNTVTENELNHPDRYVK